MNNNRLSSVNTMHPEYPTCSACGNLAEWAGKVRGEVRYYCDHCKQLTAKHNPGFIVTHGIVGIWECAKCGRDRVHVAHCSCAVCGTHTAPPTRKEMDDLVGDIVDASRLVERRLNTILAWRLAPLNDHETKRFKAYNRAKEELKVSFAIHAGARDAFYPS